MVSLYWVYFFKETRGYILSFFALVILFLLFIFFPSIGIVALLASLLWAIIAVICSNTREFSPPTAQNKTNININKISSVSTENSISVYTDIDNTANTIKIIIENPETKNKTKPIIFEIKNIVSDTGVIRTPSVIPAQAGIQNIHQYPSGKPTGFPPTQE